MDLLSKAIIIATKAHAGQLDKGGNPYVLHPITVMGKVDTIEQKIVAVLHDVIEDTNITIDKLRAEGFPDVIIDAVIALSKIEGEKYFDFIARCKENELSKKVKIVDLEHNLDMSRIKNPTQQDFKRLKRYEKALNILINKGD